MLYDIVTGQDNPTLHQVCTPVEVFDDDLHTFTEDLIETMTTKNEYGQIGVGIAAPQVGELRRVMVVTFSAFDANRNMHKNRKITVMINPEILKKSDQEVTMEEGCLSLPHMYGSVKRAAKIHARWQNAAGHWCEKKLDGWDARIFLHELDHLDGILFLQRMRGQPTYEPPTD